MTDDADLDRFEFVTELGTRFRDIDSMGHVNNAVYATYLEQARADYFRDVLDERLSDVRTVLVSLELEFHAPIELGETVRVGLAIPDLGERSIPMEYAVHGDDGLAATGETVQVPVDDDGARPVPDRWRERIVARREP
ncbi:MAG: acyl-CoA thioesterase [Haloferacaceae archaeon]